MSTSTRSSMRCWLGFLSAPRPPCSARRRSPMRPRVRSPRRSTVTSNPAGSSCSSGPRRQARGMSRVAAKPTACWSSRTRRTLRRSITCSQCSAGSTAATCRRPRISCSSTARLRSNPTGTARWLDQRPFVSHHHLRAGDAGDLERLGRHLTGRTVHLALGGGGARALSQIGAIRGAAGGGDPDRPHRRLEHGRRDGSAARVRLVRRRDAVAQPEGVGCCRDPADDSPSRWCRCSLCAPRARCSSGCSATRASRTPGCRAS